MSDRMTLGWFVNYMPTAWNRPWAGSSATAWTSGDFYIEMARWLERASLDFIMLEDSSVVPENYGGDTTAEFQATTKSPKHDPLPLAAAIAAATAEIGIVTTMSTSLYPPSAAGPPAVDARPAQRRTRGLEHRDELRGSRRPKRRPRFVVGA